MGERTEPGLPRGLPANRPPPSPRVAACRTLDHGGTKPEMGCQSVSIWAGFKFVPPYTPSLAGGPTDPQKQSVAK